MVHTRRAGDSLGNTSTEMPVKASHSAENQTLEDKQEGEEAVATTEAGFKGFSDNMEEPTKDVHSARDGAAPETSERELRRHVSFPSSSQDHDSRPTRSRDKPDRYCPDNRRKRFLPPRESSRMAYNMRQRGSDYYYEDEEDTNTEDEVFSRSSRRRGAARRNRSTRIVDTSQESDGFRERRSSRMTNGHSSALIDDPLNDSHETEGVRRSTRQRKLVYSNFNTSWIFDAQTVRGYPVPMVSRRIKEEEEPSEGEETGEETDEEGQEEEGGGGGVQEKEGDEAESGEEQEEGAEGAAEKGTRKGVEKQEQANDEAFEDMYSRVKRPRRRCRPMRYTDQMMATGRRTRSESRKVSSDEDGQSSDDEIIQRPQSPRRRSKYHLRQHKPKVERFQIEEMRAEPLRRAAISLLRSPMRRKRIRRARFARSSSSSSSSGSDYDRKKNRNRNRCLPVNVSAAELKSMSSQTGKSGGKGPTVGNLADTDPMELDPTIRFTHVGGLDEHIRCLKEMVVFPMLYPEIFEKFKVQPPKGVLFHGPPGTGKTLLARALANECSQGGRRVTFFMRKGADCLSKWVGESERQLRLLFEQAYQMRPSIIFFDELDGLAPVRSCKQDQIHASIVSTLLALMDGLKNRGDVILIGATNRIDAIDPALRRPGRFDRELYFPLPAAKERLEILNIHMSSWEQPPPPELVSHLAEMASGYCGSDLRALCTEAVIQGLRRRYPQIYDSSDKLLLDTKQVMVEKGDFQRAQLGIVPAAQRMMCSPIRGLSTLIQPLLQSGLDRVLNKIKVSFPHAMMKSAIECKLLPSPVPHPRFLLSGTDCQGHVAHIGPALLHFMEHVSVHSLELGSLYGTPGTVPEEACVQIFREARRQLPSVIYVPEIDRWWTLVPATVQALLTSRLASLEPNTPVLLFATANCELKELPLEVRELFSEYRGEVMEMENPGLRDREEFFRPLLLTKALEPPSKPECKKLEKLEKLPLAPPPEPPKLTKEQEAELYKKEEHTLRELRIFLREICAKLARNKQFFMFVQPVDLEEAPDYLEIIQNPMDLETVMSKIDRHEYACAAEFLSDIKLICSNALEYNPDTSNQGKMIRHRACYLHDTALALIKAEMDSDFEDKCKGISDSRNKRAFQASKLAPEFVHTARTAPVKKDAPEATNGLAGESSHQDDEGKRDEQVSQTPPGSEGRPKKRKSPWARGMLPSRKKKRNLEEKDGASPGTDAGGRCTPTAVEGDEEAPMDESLPKSPGPKQETPQKMQDEKTADLNASLGINPLPGTSTSPRCSTRKSSERRQSCAGLEEKEPTFKVDRGELQHVFHRSVKITEGLPLTPILDLHAQLTRIVNAYSKSFDRSTLPQELLDEVTRFERLVLPDYQ